MALRDVNAVVTITTNAVKAIDDGKKLKQVYADINEQLNLMRAEGKVDTSEFKDLQKLAEDTKAKINEMLRGMELIDKVMGDLSGHIGKDLNRALRETSKEFNKTSSDTDEGRAKLEKLRDVVSELKRELSDRKGLTMSLKEAEDQLKTLNNASLDKLRQGLKAVQEEADKATDPSKRERYQGYARQYEAQMAVTQYGRAGNASLGSMNADQLRAEQSRLRSAYLATDGAQGYETISKEYLDRLLNVNKALQDISETERKRAQAAREAVAAQEQKNKVDEIYDRWNQKKKITLQELIELEKYERAELQKAQGLNLSDDERKNLEEKRNNLRLTVEAIKGLTEAEKKHSADNVMSRLWNGQKVSLQELIQTQKTYEEQLSQMKGVNLSAQDQQQVDILERNLERVKQAMTDITQIDVQKTLNNLDTRNLQQLEAALKQVKETITTIPAWNEGDLRQAADDADRLQDAIDELKAKMEGIDNLDFDNLEHVPTEKLEAALKNLEAQEKKLAGTDKQAAQQMAENKRKVQAQITRNKQAVQDYANAEKIAGETGKHNVTELRQAYETLQQKLMSLATGQKNEIAEVRRQMKQVKSAIDETTGSIAKQGGAWSTAIKNITAYVGVFGAFNFVKNKLQEVIRGGEELSDQMAQVRMVSGLAMSDIEELTRRLAKMDTRTTLQELEQISYAGAKLGFGSQGIEGLEEFTRAANQVNVALREDLGEEALTALSKITENMGLIKKMGVEDAMLATSSAMFKLAATSTAAAGPIVEVTKRLAPVAQMSGFAAHEVLALASASDSLQLMPEVVGTALSKLIMALQNNHNLIEKYLSIPEGTIASMFKAGQSMDALMLVMDKMSGKNVTELDGLWKLLGSDGQRLITVVADMANHTDTLRSHLETSTKAFKEATAVTEEYNIQQETAMAYLLRAENLWRNAFINPDSSLSVKEMTKAWYDFTKSILDSERSMSGIKLAIDTLLISLRILIALLPGIAFGAMAKGAKMLYDRMLLAKVATDGFTTSWKKMDAATKSNWIGLIVGSLVQVVFWMKEFASSTSDAEKEQKKLNQAIENMHENQEKEIGNLDRLKKQLDNTNISQEERNALLKKVRSDYDIYLNYLGIEKDAVVDLTKHYDALVKVMKQRFAYQEREDYKRDVMGGEDGLRMRRRTAGSELSKFGKSQGVDVDLDMIQTYVQGGATADQIIGLMFPDINRAANATKAAETAARTAAGPGAAVGKRSSGSQQSLDFKNRVQAYVASIVAERQKESEIDAAFASEIGDFDYDKWLRTQVMGEFKVQPDKEAEKNARKAAQERKKELKTELDQAKRNSDAVMSKVEE